MKPAAEAIRSAVHHTETVAIPDTRPPVFAAGGVVWRERKGALEVLMVHRTKYRDVSLPKGKVDPGEMLATTAVREIEEETGVRVTLGPPVGQSVYRHPSGRSKVVQYWAAEATNEAVKRAAFTPNKEIAALEWATLDVARDRLSYPVDLAIIDRFADLVAADGLRTFPIVLLHHARARRHEEWTGSDRSRPLHPQGRAQAKTVAGALGAFAVRKIISAPAVRCVSTVEPYAKAAKRKITVRDDLSLKALQGGAADLSGLIAKRVDSGKPSVICGHELALPELVHELTLATRTAHSPELDEACALTPGSFAIAHVRASDPLAGLVAVESHSPGA
ncbi:MAG: NUDIX domain-containing protein [Microbacterium sp.]